MCRLGLPQLMVRPQPSRGQTSVLMRLHILVAMLSIFLTLASCRAQALPLAEWRPLWQDTVEQIQDMSDEPISQQECNQTLGFLRERRPELSPPPLEDLSGPVDSWFDLAEHAFFECEFVEPESEVSDVFQRLQVLESEVELVLDLER